MTFQVCTKQYSPYYCTIHTHKHTTFTLGYEAVNSRSSTCCMIYHLCSGHHSERQRALQSFTVCSANTLRCSTPIICNETCTRAHLRTYQQYLPISEEELLSLLAVGFLVLCKMDHNDSFVLCGIHIRVYRVIN